MKHQGLKTMEISEILGRLNAEQLQDATSLYGVRRTIAGPGTGKTGTQVAQIANFINEGVDPSSILAITFTNKAADETRHRIVKSVGDIGWQVTASTYHSFCRKWILKPNENHEFFHNLGYKQGFIILDDSDSLNAMREVKGRLKSGQGLMLDAIGLNEKGVLKEISSFRADGISLLARKDQLRNIPSLVADYQSIINRYPASAIDKKSDSYDTFLEEVRDELHRNPRLIDPLIVSLWSEYTKECSATSGIDFDDQILYSKQLLESDPSIAKRLSKRFTRFCLDEYQDVNQCQWDVIYNIVKHTLNPNLFIVGDDRQSIYRFRKAKVELMMNFDQLFPNCVTNNLVKNYRSSRHIIALGNAHALTMTNQIGMGQLESGLNKEGSLPVYGRFNDGKAEARWVSSQIKLMLDSGENPKDIAILYRGHAMNSDVVEELTKNNLDYSIVGDLDFYQTAEVKSTIAVLRVLTRDRDIFALSKVLEYATVGVSPARLKAKHHEIGGLPLEIIKGILATDKRAANKGTEFYDDLVTLIAKATKVLPLSEFLKIVLTDESQKKLYLQNPESKKSVDEIFINYRDKSLRTVTGAVSDFWQKHILPNFQKDAEKLVKKKGDDSTSEQIEEILTKRLRNMEIVLERIHAELLESTDMRLSDAIDELVLKTENSKNIDLDAISLMTNHASKGLEFKHVFAIGAEQECYIKEDASAEDIDEESRNFYVAITRAAENLFITSAASRYLHGNIFSREELMFIKGLKPLMNCIDARRTNYGNNTQQNQIYSGHQQEQVFFNQHRQNEPVGLNLEEYLDNLQPGGF